MLRVTIHAGRLKTASRFNVTNILDIGYEKLHPVADYKVVLFSAGVGATPPVSLLCYARWSASLWDLVARALALTLSSDIQKPSERVPAFEEGGKRAAFATAICALIEHFAAGDETRRTTLGTAEVVQDSRVRCLYDAAFTEDTMPSVQANPFMFAPKFLRPAELLLRACLMRLTGNQDQMPLRPPLARATAVVRDGRPFVPIHELPEPARTGFLRWAKRNSEPPVIEDSFPDGVAPEPLYATFLAEAV